MATADEHGKNLQLGEAGNDAHAIGLALKVHSVSLSVMDYMKTHDLNGIRYAIAQELKDINK